MDEKQRQKIDRLITTAGIVVLLVVVAYLLYAGLILKKIGRMYGVVLGISIFLFWLLEDVIKPILTKSLEGKSPQFVSDYKKCAALSLLGYAGLVWFAVSIGGGAGIYGAVVYVVCLMTKRRIQSEHAENEEEGETEADGAVIDAEASETDVDEADVLELETTEAAEATEPLEPEAEQTAEEAVPEAEQIVEEAVPEAERQDETT